MSCVEGGFVVKMLNNMTVFFYMGLRVEMTVSYGFMFFLHMGFTVEMAVYGSF